VQIPLRNIYTNGPRSLGFWGGAPNESICAKLNPSTDAGFWLASPLTVEQCAAQVARDANGFVVFAETVIYAFTCYELMRASVWLVFAAVATIPATFCTACKNVASWWKGNNNVGLSARVPPAGN
jgi:hypothetical protein